MSGGGWTRSGDAGGSGAVAHSLWRALGAYRIATAGLALYLVLIHQHRFVHPERGYAVAVLILMWTVVAVTVAIQDRFARPGWVAADVAVAAALTAATVLVQSAADRHGSLPTLTTAWAVAAAIGAGIWGGWQTALAASAVQGAVTIYVHDGWDGNTLFNIFLIVLAATVAAYVSRLALHAEAELAAATALRAATAERERLARNIHDGVLQVLALVQRRGREAGGEAAELARLAGAQEAALRALVTSGPGATDDDAAGADGRVDLIARLAALRAHDVTVSVPAGPILLPAAVAHELVAATVAALDNVARHAGTPAWVLCEDLGEQVAVTVRDDGPGIATGRLDEARAQGRIGVAGSITGRMDAIGGRAQIVSAPGLGTEVELTVSL